MIRGKTKSNTGIKSIDSISKIINEENRIELDDDKIEFFKNDNVIFEIDSNSHHNHINLICNSELYNDINIDDLKGKIFTVDNNPSILQKGNIITNYKDVNDINNCTPSIKLSDTNLSNSNIGICSNRYPNNTNLIKLETGSSVHYITKPKDKTLYSIVDKGVCLCWVVKNTYNDIQWFSNLFTGKYTYFKNGFPTGFTYMDVKQDFSFTMNSNSSNQESISQNTSKIQILENRINELLNND